MHIIVVYEAVLLCRQILSVPNEETTRFPRNRLVGALQSYPLVIVLKLLIENLELKTGVLCQSKASRDQLLLVYAGELELLYIESV